MDAAVANNNEPLHTKEDIETVRGKDPYRYKKFVPVRLLQLQPTENSTTIRCSLKTFDL